jgi:hypothetical protein
MKAGVLIIDMGAVATGTDKVHAIQHHNMHVR